MKKKLIYAFAAIFLLAGLFVLGDYFALFGTKTRWTLDFAEGTFRTVDAETGGLVLQVVVRCVQKMTERACAQRNSGKANIVSIHLPIKRIITESLLFKQSEKIEQSTDPTINIKFIHKDYRLAFQEFQTEDFYAGKFNDYVIKMNRVDWGEEAE